MATVNLSSMLPLVAGIAIIFIAGYLLIYNVFYISIAQDIRFYGMLKTLGTTARQIRKIVYRKAIKLSLMGIPIGLLLGWPIGRLLLPAIVNMLTDDIRIVTTVNPLIFLVAIVFSAITVFISCQNLRYWRLKFLRWRHCTILNRLVERKSSGAVSISAQ